MPASLDAVFAALSNRDRRRLLRELLERERRDGGPVLVPEDIGRPGQRVRTLHLALYHTHLPKLEAQGLVEWDRECGTVRPGPEFELVRPLLELLDENAEALPGAWV